MFQIKIKSLVDMSVTVNTFAAYDGVYTDEKLNSAILVEV